MAAPPVQARQRDGWPLYRTTAERCVLSQRKRTDHDQPVKLRRLWSAPREGTPRSQNGISEKTAGTQPAVKVREERPAAFPTKLAQVGTIT